MIPGWEDPLEKEMATHSSILAWEIPRTEELGRHGVTKELDTAEQLTTFTYTVFEISTKVRNADIIKSMASQRRPASLIETPFRDCSVLAVHQIWGGKGNFSPRGLPGRASLGSHGQD